MLIYIIWEYRIVKITDYKEKTQELWTLNNLYLFCNQIAWEPKTEKNTKKTWKTSITHRTFREPRIWKPLNPGRNEKLGDLGLLSYPIEPKEQGELENQGEQEKKQKNWEKKNN